MEHYAHPPGRGVLWAFAGGRSAASVSLCLKEIMPLAFQTMGVPALAIEALYAATLCYGLFSDYKRFIIPNAVSLIIAGLFFLHRWLAAPQEPLAFHLVAGAAAFVLFLAPYYLGQMAAGDVKLIGALMLWAGARDAFPMLLIMTAIGGVLAALLLIARKSISIWPSVSGFLPARVSRWARVGIMPYGLAICMAGLVLMPAFFAPPQ